MSFAGSSERGSYYGTHWVPNMTPSAILAPTSKMTKYFDIPVY